MGLTGVWVVVATLVVGVAVGVLLRRRDGRISDTAAPRSAASLPAPVADALGDDVTLVQLSTTFCAPCRHTKARLSSLAERTDGLSHVDIDVSEDIDVARALGVMRTPTTIAYTADGAELFRVGGLPDADDVLSRVRPHLSATSAV